MSTANLPVSPADLAVAQSRHTVWATVFTVWATEKTVAQTVEVPLGHEKRAPQRPLSSFALQRYNKTRRKANRRRRTQNGKIRKKGKWRRVVVPCPLTWHSVLVAAPAATPFLCRRNAAVPGMSRQWVRPHSSTTSIDVVLRTSSWCPATIPFFVGVLIGVAPIVATSTESHVNGRGTTIGVQPRYQVLNQGVASEAA